MPCLHSNGSDSGSGRIGPHNGGSKAKGGSLSSALNPEETFLTKPTIVKNSSSREKNGLDFLNELSKGVKDLIDQ